MDKSIEFDITINFEKLLNLMRNNNKLLSSKNLTLSEKMSVFDNNIFLLKLITADREEII